MKTQETTEKKEVLRSAQEMISLYEELTTEYPLISIEDGLDEDDWEGWQELTKRMKEQVMLVGDDLFVTNVKRIRCGMDLKVANGVLIKVNQIGTLTEAMDAIELAQKNGYKAIISHRSGETEDSFIADLAVAVNAGWIKTVPKNSAALESAIPTEESALPSITSFCGSVKHYKRFRRLDMISGLTASEMVVCLSIRPSL